MDSLYSEENVEEEVNLNKRYHFPTDIVVRKFQDKNLVIYTEGVLWLVFSDKELTVYNFLSDGGNIEEALSEFDEETVINVISQIEAKNFEHPIVRESEDQNIYIYLTNNCNEHCKHCYMYAGDIKIQELPISTWERVLYNYKKYGGKGVTFTGGEVTVYPDFKSLLRYTHKLGLSVTVLTNGILWSEKDIRECAPLIDEVQISIDGYDRASYFNVRQFDGFDTALKNLIFFSKCGTRASMAVTPLYEDIDNFVEQFEPFARNILDQYPNVFIRFNLELLEGRDIKTTEINNPEYREKIRKLVERLYPDYYTESFPLNYEGHILRRNCGFGEIAIAANGDIFWCNRIHELNSKVNVLTTDFEDILRLSKEMKTKTDVDHSAACQSCEVRYICGGDCRMNYKGIRNADDHNGLWDNDCPPTRKEYLYKKMIACNEYFYTNLNEE